MLSKSPISVKPKELSCQWLLRWPVGLTLMVLLLSPTFASEPVCDGKLERHIQDGVEFLSPPGFEGFRIVPIEQCDLSGPCSYDVILSQGGKTVVIESNLGVGGICDHVFRADEVENTSRFEDDGIPGLSSFDSVRTESTTIRADGIWVLAQISTYFSSSASAVEGLWEGDGTGGGRWSYSTKFFEVISGIQDND
jgi:hypothetical protein